MNKHMTKIPKYFQEQLKTKYKWKGGTKTIKLPGDLVSKSLM